VGIAGTILGFRSIQQIRDEAKITVDAEVAKVQTELQHMRNDVDESAVEAKRKVQQQLDSEQGEVKRRIDAEFQTEEITKLVQTVAKERTERESNAVIRAEVVKGIQQQAPTIHEAVASETKRAVHDLEPTIASVVKAETEGQIANAVDPVRSQMKAYGDEISINTLANLAKNGDRKAFDTLNSRVTYADKPSMLEFGQTTVQDIQRQYENTLRMGRDFVNPTTPDQMKDILQRNPDVSGRITALDKFPPGDHSIVPILIQVIQNDSSLEVVYTAFQVLNRETHQQFRFPDYAAVTIWWEQNKNDWH
jgi:Skp family chaperone for outer membrane proteins